MPGSSEKENARDGSKGKTEERTVSYFDVGRVTGGGAGLRGGEKMREGRRAIAQGGGRFHPGGWNHEDPEAVLGVRSWLGGATG